jgi:phosphoribosylanthranilate isomerase
VNTPLKIKICGITNRDDAQAAIDAGADALGFNLFPGSRRHVPLSALTPFLPSIKALRVALMVNPTVEEIRDASPYFDVIQLHGQETAELSARAAALAPIWKAFPLGETLDEATVAPYQAQSILIDTSLPGAFGGTGVLIDLDKAARFVASCPARQIWLSGGLTPENVALAIQKVRPYGVDVSSGVEFPGDPRRKAPARLQAFVAAARSAAALD